MSKQDTTETPAGDQKTTQDVLASIIDDAVHEMNRERSGLLLSGLSAGLDIGFGPLLMAVLLTVAEFSFATPLTRELLMANAYALGFIFVIIGRSELFTEHTTLAVLPVLDGQASLHQLARLWSIVYVGNLVGASIFAGFAVLVLPAMGTADPKAFVTIATALTDHHWTVLLAGGVLAGWLMGLLSWLVAAAQETTSRVLLVWLIASAIGFLHLPHSIAGTVEVLAGVFVSPAVTVGDFAVFLTAATIGNALGGSIFVSLLKYGHVTRSG